MTYKSLTSLFLVTCAVALNTPAVAVAKQFKGKSMADKAAHVNATPSKMPGNGLSFVR